MNDILAYELGEMTLNDLQESLQGLGECEYLEIGSNRLTFYLQLITEGETFDYSTPIFADWENSLNF
ncbi:hypothetical protein [Carnobacterium maltaromaticum]|uniref:hypothetical protein n=1 Tax=Carnobacterium maltaromaticum TaxID=2751 RepID=UPI00295EF786|nr:hypothetical protein [Carnobacterium maltaromaticum]